MELPLDYHLAYSEEQISEGVSRIARSIEPWCVEIQTQTAQDVLAIPVLRGGIFFFAKLLSKIRCSVELAVAHSQAYEFNKNQTPRTEVRASISGISFKDRHVLLVDDVCDSGRTLKTLSDLLLSEGALAVRTAVLIRRTIGNQVFNPDWSVFNYNGPEWFVGFGMDDKNHWANLPDVYLIR